MKKERSSHAKIKALKTLKTYVLVRDMQGYAKEKNSSWSFNVDHPSKKRKEEPVEYPIVFYLPFSSSFGNIVPYSSHFLLISKVCVENPLGYPLIVIVFLVISKPGSLSDSRHIGTATTPEILRKTCMHHDRLNGQSPEPEMGSSDKFWHPIVNTSLNSKHTVMSPGILTRPPCATVAGGPLLTQPARK
ncbi:hypothetical protein M9H77_07464 [Catharanthus roseus]|uniref:Uncharacterized protein n=1 Tax=Catharanthus roseus TaxID=4058 RepID=A0ACC0BVA1_CATRO|nr:hypothetical protein M9H77_07464 [Catharanthus roseus]